MGLMAGQTLQKSRELKDITKNYTRRNTEGKRGKEHQLDKFNWMSIHIVGIPREKEWRKNI